MNRANFLLSSFAFLLAFQSLAGNVQAQDKDQQLMDAISNRLRVAVLGKNSATAGKVGTSEFVLMVPGKVIDMDPLMVAGPTSQTQAAAAYRREYIHAEVNSLPAASRYYTPSGGNLEEIWSKILSLKKTPKQNPTPAQEKEMDDLEDYLSEDGGDPKWPGKTREDLEFEYYQAYQNAETAKFDQDWAAPRLKDEAGNPAGKLPHPKFAAEMVRAKTKWESTRFGNGLKVKEKQERRRELQGGNVKTYFAGVQDGWNSKFKVEGESIHKVNLYPNVPEWGNKAGWSTIELNTKEWFKENGESRASAAAGGSGSYGLFTIRASGGGNKKVTQSFDHSGGVELKVDIKRVMIYRPWLEVSVLKGGFWGWGKPGATRDEILKDNILRDGFLNISSGIDLDKRGALDATELMPMLPVELVLARNVVVTANFSDEQIAESTETFGGGGGVSFGPFSFGGSASQTVASKMEKGADGKGSLSFKGIQIIGLNCMVMPKIPNPSPLLDWSE